MATSEDRAGVHERLVALGEAPSIEDVAKIVGNQSWSYLSCEGCSDYVERGVRIGEFEAKIYCATCIGEAALVLGVTS